MNNVLTTIAYFAHPDTGRPVAGGQVYVGISDTDPEIESNQKQVYALQEDGSTVPIAQPVSLSVGGYALYDGSPVTLKVDGEFSLKVTSSTGEQIFYIPVATLSASEITYTASVTGAVEQTLQDRLDTTVFVENFGAVGDGVTDDSEAIQAAVDAKPKGLIFSKNYLIETPIEVSSDAVFIFDGCTFTGSSLGVDCFQFSGSVDITGQCEASLFRTFIHFDPISADCSLLVSGVRGSNMHSVIAGRPDSGLIQCEQLNISNVIYTDVEYGIYIYNYYWTTATVTGTSGYDVKLKAVPTSARDSLLYTKYACVGAYIYSGTTEDANTSNITMTGNSVIKVNNTLVDPYTSTALPSGPEYETHGLAAVRQYNGRITVSGNTVVDVAKPDGELDCEGILARGSTVTVVGNSMLDGGTDEGSIYVKASLKAVVVGNIVEYSEKKEPSDAKNQRGIVVSCTTYNVSNNSFIKCERGVTFRGGEGTFSANIFDDCYYGIYFVATAAVEHVAVINNTFTDTNFAFIPLSSTGGSVEYLTFSNNVVSGCDRIASAPDDTWRNVIMENNTFIGDGITTLSDDTLPIGNGASAAQPFTFIFKENTVKDFIYLSTSGSFIFAGDGTYDTVVITGNCFDNLKYPMWMRDRTYDNLIVKGNTHPNPISGGLLIATASITVNEIYHIKDNVYDEQRATWGDTASRPAVARVEIGTTYFDTDLGYLIASDGTNWVDSTGSTV